MIQDNIRNYIKARITEEGYTMDEVLQILHEEYQWSRSLSNFSAKLSRGTLRYTEAVQIADILGYDVIWKKRGGVLMPRPRKVNDLAFFQNDRCKVQYCEMCMDCQKNCKQSLRAVIVRCPRFEPVPTCNRRKAVVR